MKLPKLFNSIFTDKNVDEPSLNTRSLAQVASALSDFDVAGQIFEFREKFLSLYLEFFERDQKALAALWLYSQRGDSKELVLWALNSQNIELNSTEFEAVIHPVSAIADDLDQFAEGDHITLTGKLGLRRFFESCFSFGNGDQKLEEYVFPIFLNGLVGVIHIVNVQGANGIPAFSRKIEFENAFALSTIFASRITLGRKQRTGEAINRFQSEIELATTLEGVWAAIQSSASSFASARYCFICARGPNDNFRVVSRSVGLDGRDDEHLLRLSKIINREISCSGTAKTMRINDVSPLLKGDNGKLLDNLKIELSGSKNIAWLSLLVCTKCHKQGSDIPIFTVNLICSSNDKSFLGGVFSETDEQVMESIGLYSAKVVPPMILENLLKEFTSEKINSNTQEEVSVTDNNLDAVAPHFIERARKEVWVIESGMLVNITVLNGEKSVKFTGEDGSPILEPPPYDNLNLFTSSQVEILSDGEPYIGVPVFTHQQISISVLFKLRRENLAEFEYLIIQLIASEIRYISMGQLDVDEKLMQIAEIRHALRAGLTGFLSNVKVASKLYDQARKRPALTQKLLIDVASYRKNNARAWLAAQQVHSLFEDARILIANISRENLQITQVNMRDLVRDTINTFSHEAARRDLGLIFIDNYPQTAPDPMVDRAWMSLTVFNLVENAIKYSYRGNQVKIELNYFRGHWGFSVENFGRFIPEESQDEIFLPFTRLKGSKGEQAMPGTGLGLPTVKKIIEAHDFIDGSIYVESEIIETGNDGSSNARTKFSFNLPRTISGP